MQKTPRLPEKVRNNPVVNAEVVRTVLVTVLGYFGYQLSDDLMAFAVSGGVLVVSWALSLLARHKAVPVAKLQDPNDAEAPMIPSADDYAAEDFDAEFRAVVNGQA